MEAFKERLQYLIDSENISQTALARGIGVQQSRISDWLKGKPDNPHRRSCVKLATFFECNVDWLQKNIGEPFPQQNAQSTVTATNGSMSTGNIISGNNTQGEIQFQNPDILTVARLIEELESPAAIKVMIRKYEKMKKDMKL